MRSSLIVVMAVVALSASACGDGEAGVPTPSQTDAPTTTTTAPTTTTAATTTTGEREVSYLRDELCELLTPEETARWNVGNPRPTNSISTGSEQCQWGGDLGFTIDFTGQSDGNLAGEGTVSEIKVAGTPAVMTKTTESTGLCVVRIALNEGRSSMSFGVGVRSSGRGKGYVPCDVAKQVAEIVIPKVKG